MFGHRYFSARYFGPRYWGDGGSTPPPTPTVTLDGSGLRFLRGHRPQKPKPEEIEREQRMVQEYLDSLEQKKNASERIERLPARVRKREEAKAKAAPVPQLTEAMAAAASDKQIGRILEAAAAREEDRKKARAEFERRYWDAFISLAMND